MRNNMNTNYYLVKRYCGGPYDHYSVNVFVTDNESLAKKYVDKFNRILKKLKKHYEKFETKNGGIADDFEEKYDSWEEIRRVNKCYYEEVSFR